MEHSDDAIISKSLDGIIKSWNKGGEKMFGYNANEAIGKHISLIIPPEYNNDEKKIIERIRNNEIIDHYETIRIRKSGERFYVSLTVSPFKDRAGSIVAASKIARDITSRKKSEAELICTNKELAFQNEEKEKRATELMVANKEISDYKYALDESSIIAITDQKGIIKKVNNNFCLISKYSEEELIGQDHRIINSGYHTKEFIRNLWLTIANGKIWRGELKNKAKDGAFYWVDTTIVPFLNELGKPYQYLAIRADITARKETEEYLIQRTAQLETANKALVFQHEEKEKRAAELNIANIELALQNEEKGKRAEELFIANIELAFQHEEKEKRAAELNIANIELAYQNDQKGKRAAELVIANVELAYQNDQKEKRAAELFIANKELSFQNTEKEKRAKELLIANKELAYQNDQKEKRAEELVVANKELAYQNDEKEKRAEELVSANKELVAFSYVSSHDLQEPLRKIQTFVTILLERENQNLSDDGKYNMQRIQAAVTRMRLLIKDLLAFSRLNSDERKFEKTDLTIIVDEVKTDLQDIIYAKQATIEIAELGSCNIIPFQFRQLMHNLIGNALKFSNRGMSSHIIIKSKIVKGSKLISRLLSTKKKYCHISVADNGIGFEPHLSELIFEVFQKLHSNEEYMGTGIGLAIVKKIVENHNGIIIATGELNKGATFDIYIPDN